MEQQNPTAQHHPRKRRVWPQVVAAVAVILVAAAFTLGKAALHALEGVVEAEAAESERAFAAFQRRALPITGPCDGIEIDVDDRRMTITVVNSQMKTLPDGERKARVDELVTSALESWNVPATLETV